MNAREAMLARVRRSLGRPAGGSGGLEAPPPVLGDAARTVRADQELVAMFIERATVAGMRVRRTSSGELGQLLGGVLAGCGAARVCLSVRSVEMRSVVQSAIAARGMTTIDDDAGPGLDALYEADVGITDVTRAIAESGSVVISVGEGRSRGTFLVPPVHVAIVGAGQIVPDLLDHFEAERASGGSEQGSMSVIVSGPSKTADIEGILITGVHGPHTVEVLLVEDQ